MSAIPHHHREDHKQHSLMFKDEPSHHHHHHHGAPGQGSTTLFAPANLAWTRIPLRIKLYLFSPFGQRSLMYLLALHSLPNTIFYADFVHEAKGGKLAPAKQYTVDAASIRSATGDLTVAGKGNVTEYEFATACPKLHFNHTSEAWTESKMEFETVTVKVFRYFLLPGNKGPLQTRVQVQDVPVLIQDIATANGAIHQVERFVLPRDLPHRDSGLWAFVSHQAEKAGFGAMDLAELK